MRDLAGFAVGFVYLVCALAMLHLVLPRLIGWLSDNPPTTVDYAMSALVALICAIFWPVVVAGLILWWPLVWLGRYGERIK